MEPSNPSIDELSDSQQKSWRSYVEGSTILTSALAYDLELSAGLSMGEYEILVRLSEAKDETLRMSQLAQQLTHSRSRVSHTVSRIEEFGFVSRVPSNSDRRGIDCVLTDAGREALQRITPHHMDSVRDRIVDVISEEELAQLGDIFRKIAQASGGTPTNVRFR